MKYKGVVFVLGVDMPESLKNMDSKWEKYFDDISVEKPRDDVYSFSTRRRGNVDIMPLIGKRGEDYVLICPTTPSVLEKWDDKEIHGTVRQRAPLYMPDSDMVIGLGKCGSYVNIRYGEIILPGYAENSENLMQKGGLRIKGGYSDKDIQEHMSNFLYEIWVRPGPGLVSKIISLADIEEVIAQSEEDKKQRWKEGYWGSDMETAWLLGYSNEIGKRVGSLLVTYDLPGDRPFEEPIPTIHRMDCIPVISEREAYIADGHRKIEKDDVKRIGDMETVKNMENIIRDRKTMTKLRKEYGWEKATEAAIECILR